MLRRNLQRIFTCGQKQECGLQDQGQQVQEQQDELVETVLEAFEKFHDFRKVDKTLSSMVQDSAHPRQSLQTIASSIFHGDFDENVGDKDSNLGSEDSNLGSEDSNLGSEDSNLAFDPNPTEREVLEEIVYSPHYNQHIASPLENTGKILERILIKLAHDERITLTSRSATIVILESLIETLPKEAKKIFFEKQNQKNEANVTAKVNLLSESILCCCRRSPSKNDYDNIIRPSINNVMKAMKSKVEAKSAQSIINANRLTLRESGLEPKQNFQNIAATLSLKNVLGCMLRDTEFALLIKNNQMEKNDYTKSLAPVLENDTGTSPLYLSLIPCINLPHSWWL